MTHEKLGNTMKKTFILSALIIASVTTLSAQKIRTVSGSIDPIAEQTQMGALFTYENMQVGKLREADYIERKVSDYNKDEPGQGDQWRENWMNDRKGRFEPKFLELFNKYMSEDSRNGGITLIPDDGETKYLFHVNTYFTEPGFNIGIMRQNASVTLDINVLDRETGDVISRVLVENASANSFSGLDFDTGFRIQECYAKAGREYAKFLIKNLKL
jgi:hypothetical protein